MTVNFYTCNDDIRKLEKTLNNPIEVDITLKENNKDVSDFDIILKTDIQNKNYCYIPKWNKYYFINDKIIMSNELFKYRLSIDVLMTYRQKIKNARLNIVQCDYRFINPNYAKSEKTDVFNFRKIDVDNTFFNDSSIILVVKK